MTPNPWGELFAKAACDAAGHKWSQQTRVEELNDEEKARYGFTHVNLRDCIRCDYSEAIGWAVSTTTKGWRWYWARRQAGKPFAGETPFARLSEFGVWAKVIRSENAFWRNK